MEQSEIRRIHRVDQALPEIRTLVTDGNRFIDACLDDADKCEGSARVGTLLIAAGAAAAHGLLAGDIDIKNDIKTRNVNIKADGVGQMLFACFAGILTGSVWGFWWGLLIMAAFILLGFTTGYVLIRMWERR